MEVSEYVYIIDHGRIISEGTKEEILKDSRDIIDKLVGI